jgi:prolyl-tRNA editing enzyme YbaK/EbsC (Cys-tRNA(Pro) deacylase)
LNPGNPKLSLIIELLDGEGISYRRISHEPTRTSEDSARARGEALETGGKALLLKAGENFSVFVLSAALKLDSQAVKKRLGVKSLRFATADELMDLTGLVPGSVPPFGEPVLPFPLFVDVSIEANDRIAFNAGSLTDSVVLSTVDYLRVAGGEIFRFSV